MIIHTGTVYTAANLIDLNPYVNKLLNHIIFNPEHDTIKKTRPQKKLTSCNK